MAKSGDVRIFKMRLFGGSNLEAYRKQYADRTNFLELRHKKVIPSNPSIGRPNPTVIHETFSIPACDVLNFTEKLLRAEEILRIEGYDEKFHSSKINRKKNDQGRRLGEKVAEKQRAKEKAN